MRIYAKGKVGHESMKRERATPSVPKVGRRARLRLPWQPCRVVAGYLLTIALCGAAVYLWQAPLPPLPVPHAADSRAALLSAAGRAGSKASLEACLRQVKLRELFKPSIPVPEESRLGKSTAQELADRLQFVGIMGGPDGLAALVFIPNRGPGTFRVGDRVAEFTLKEVQPDRLVLALGDEQATLKR